MKTKTPKPLIKDLACDLQLLIEKHTEESLWRHSREHETLKELVCELKNLINGAKRSKENMAEHMLLSINQVESEGYLRAALTVENILKSLELMK